MSYLIVVLNSRLELGHDTFAEVSKLLYVAAYIYAPNPKTPQFCVYSNHGARVHLELLF